MLCTTSYIALSLKARQSAESSTEEQLTVISLFATPSRTSILLSRHSFTVCASRSPRDSAVLCRSFVTCLNVRESASIPAPDRNIAVVASSSPTEESRSTSLGNSYASSKPARKSASRSAIPSKCIVHCAECYSACKIRSFCIFILYLK